MPKVPKQLDLEDAIRKSDPKRGRNARYEEKMRETGFVPVKLWVPEHCRAELLEMAERLRDNPELEPGPLRNRTTRRLVGKAHRD